MLEIFPSVSGILGFGIAHRNASRHVHAWLDSLSVSDECKTILDRESVQNVQDILRVSESDRKVAEKLYMHKVSV